MSYSSKIFYENKLKAHISVANHLLFKEDIPLVFVDTAGCGFDEKQDGTSTTNPEEAVLLFKHLNAQITTLSENYSKENFPSIAIISPYKQQINVLKELLNHNPDLQPYLSNISINTVDSFQGQENLFPFLHYFWLN